MRLFRDRRDAGRQLAARLGHLRGEHPVVVGLPRGGVPVAFEVALALDAPLDVIVVRKLGVPFQPELGMGAIGEDSRLPVGFEGDRLWRRVTSPLDEASIMGARSTGLHAIPGAAHAGLERAVRDVGAAHRSRIGPSGTGAAALWPGPRRGGGATFQDRRQRYVRMSKWSSGLSWCRHPMASASRGARDCTSRGDACGSAGGRLSVT